MTELLESNEVKNHLGELGILLACHFQVTDNLSDFLS